MVEMSWTDTTDCMFCGRAIPIFRKFGNGQFCTAAHEQEFRQQQNQLAVEVLHRTHDALKAYRPVGSSIEDILGPSSHRQPVAEQFASPVVASVETEEFELADDSLEFDVAAADLLPQWEDAVPDVADAVAFQAPPEQHMAPAAFHYGESLSKLHRSTADSSAWDFASLAKRLYAVLWPWGVARRT